MAFSLTILAVLMVLSGFFSASETALFSLRREDRHWLTERGTRASRCVLELLQRPRSLLVAVLFGNLLVNFLLFAVSARLLVDLEQPGSVLVLGGVATTILVLIFGEVTPKAIAVTSARSVALFTALPLLAFRNATHIVTAPLEKTVTGVLSLIERRLPAPQEALTDQELKRFVELHGQEGALEREASEFLAEALELGSRRVSEVMTPRVDLVAHEVGGDREAFMALVREHRVGKLLVHKGDLDKIHGYVRFKDILRNPDALPADLVRPIWYVPSTKSIESLLREMIERHEPIALAVGEYGGTDGLVTLEDVVEEITGDIARADALPLLRSGPDGTWTMAGRLPLREAGELLGTKFAPGPTTLSGFIAQKLGRIPEVDDVVWHARVQFKVGSVEHRRAREILVALPQPGQPAPVPIEDVPEAMTKSGALRARKRLRQFVTDTSPTGESEDE